MMLNGMAPGDLAARGINPYDNMPRVCRILIIVLVIHVASVIIPFIIGKLNDYFDPPKIVMEVALVDLPKGDSLDVPKDSVASQEQPADLPDTPEPAPEPDPVLPDPVQPDPTPIPDLPEPVPEPVPEPLPEPVPEPVPTPAPAPKKEVKPKEKTKEKTPPKKPEKKYLTADQIKKTGEKVKETPKRDGKAKRAKAEAEAKQRAEQARRQKAYADARAKALAAIQGARHTYGSRVGGEKGILATKELSDYYDTLSAFIRARWQEPNAISLNGKKPSTTIELTIDKNGTVQKVEFKTRSGVASMDESVEDLIRQLKAVPAPPMALTMPVTLKVD